MQALKEEDNLYQRLRFTKANCQQDKTRCSPKTATTGTSWIDDTFVLAMHNAMKTMWNECKFVHMDLHAGNIFYTTDGDNPRVYFIDYGLVLPSEAINKAREGPPYEWKRTYKSDAVKITSLPYALYTSLYDIHQELHTLVYEQKGYTYHALDESIYHTCVAVLYGYALNC